MREKKEISALIFLFLNLTQCAATSEEEDITPGQQLKAIQATVNQESDIAISCDFNNDPCPSQFNRVCEAGATNTGCAANTDCFDCDPCHKYHLDCQSCVDHGCVYCPGDAFCSSAPLETPIWRRLEFLFHTTIASSCLKVGDWVDACPTDGNVYADPLYDAMQWAYDLLNVESVWKRGIQGTGVRVRINDNGVDRFHPEFQGRFDVEGSCESNLPRGSHGTAVASLVAGGADNDYCAVGIAPNATLSACALDLQSTIHPNVLASVVDHKLSSFDISVNAWGMATCLPKRPQRRLQLPNQPQTCPFRTDHAFSPCHFCNFEDSPNTPSSRTCLNAIIYYCSLRYEDDSTACSDYLDLFTLCSYNALTAEQEQALTRGVQEGRDGKGVIFVFSAGNSHALGVDTNFDGWVNSRYTVSVGAVGKDGKHASYSTPGASLLVTGPGGDRESLTNNIVAVAGSHRCGDVTVGTSFSAPYVAGVIALMLEVNSELTWRDVQGILAETSTQVDPDSWTNGAGYRHSYKAGFGIPNAEAAVNAAETWELWGSEEKLTAESGVVNLTIVDDSSSSTTSVVSLDAAVAVAGIVVETVVVNISLIHASRGDLSIVLTSPEGTESVLHPGKRPENTVTMEEEGWKLMTVRNWGESAVGNWSLTLSDENLGVVDDCVDKPFEYTWQDEDAKLIWTCATLEAVGACARGNLVASFSDSLLTENRTAAKESCCACGGGMPATTKSVLHSWQLVVYGHERVTDPPSVTPRAAPTELVPSGEDETMEYDGTENMAIRSAAAAAAAASIWPSIPIGFIVLSFLALFLS